MTVLVLCQILFLVLYCRAQVKAHGSIEELHVESVSVRMQRYECLIIGVYFFQRLNVNVIATCVQAIHIPNTFVPFSVLSQV